MLRNSRLVRLLCTAPVLQGGWGSSTGGNSSSSGGSGGGWGTPAPSSGGGWGGGGGSSGSSGHGGWGGSSNSAAATQSGGWGSAGGWNDGDGGWKQAPTGRSGHRDSKPRGGFKRNRASSPGWGDGGAGVWGQPAAVNEDAWKAAPPSFTPPVRRVDPLTLTAVEVSIDGVKKLVGQRIQITGLADETSWQTLKDHLRQAGEVVFCKTFSGGRAMAELTTPDDAARVITELQGSELEGATIFIREDREDTVLLNTRRKIREAREAKLRQRKDEVEKQRAETARAQMAEAASATGAAEKSP